MLLKLLVIRLIPIIMLIFLKERKQIKLATAVVCAIYGICFWVTVCNIFLQKQWFGIIIFLISVFPHYIFYIFSLWMILRCIWQVWSIRVWKRIRFLSILCVLFGILSEFYISTEILQKFFEIFK